MQTNDFPPPESDAVGKLSRATNRGFTLLELMVILAVSAILAMIAIPSYQQFVVRAKIADATNSLRASIELARSEATARGTRVGVCRSTNTDTATPVCSTDSVDGFGARDWSIGWIVYAKTPGNLGTQFQSGDQLLRRQPRARGDVARGSMVWAPNTAPIVFNWTGVRLAGPAGSFLIDYGPVTSEPATATHSDRARCLGLNLAGRMTTVRLDGGNCA